MSNEQFVATNASNCHDSTAKQHTVHWQCCLCRLSGDFDKRAGDSGNYGVPPHHHFRLENS